VGRSSAQPQAALLALLPLFPLWSASPSLSPYPKDGKTTPWPRDPVQDPTGLGGKTASCPGEPAAQQGNAERLHSGRCGL
jgi:hypothetical protein